MKNRKLINEVRQFKKIAGLLKEDNENESMPQGLVLNFIHDIGDIEEMNGTVEELAKKTAEGYRRNGYDDVQIKKLGNDIIEVNVSGGAQTETFVGPGASNAGYLYSLYQDGLIDDAFDELEEESIPNTVEGWVDYFYSKASPKQKAKLVSIYKNQMEEEGVSDAKEFFMDLRDSGDPDAIISLKDLGKYSGY